MHLLPAAPVRAFPTWSPSRGRAAHGKYPSTRHFTCATHGGALWGFRMAIDRRLALIGLIGALWLANEMYPAQEAPASSHNIATRREATSNKSLIPRSYPEKARYFLISKEERGGIIRTLVERSGMDSVVYTLTDIDCSSMTFRFVGDIFLSVEEAAAYGKVSPEMVPTDRAEER